MKRNIKTITADEVTFDVSYIPDDGGILIYEIKLHDHDLDLYSVLSDKTIFKIFRQLEET